MSSRELGDREKRRTVPKFSSFKPKPNPEPRRGEVKDEARASERDEDSKRPRHRHGDRDERKDRRESRESERRHERDRYSSSRKDTARIQTTKLIATEAPNDIFFVDKRGDPLIIRYGANDRSTVPSYYRDGNGRVMGSTGYLQIYREGSKEVFTIRYGGTDKGSIFRDRNAVKLALSMGANAKLIKPARDAGKLPTADDDYIALESGKRKREAEASSVPEYRSIYTLKGSDSDSESESNVSTLGRDDTDFSATKKRSIELNRQVRANPEDASSWFELIALQEALFRESRDNPTQLMTVDERKALAELKLSLYEEALGHVTELKQKERLAEGMLRDGPQVWNDELLKKRLSKLTDGYQNSFTLWRARLDTMLKGSDCSYEELKLFLTDKLSRLSGELSEACRDGADEQVVAFTSQLIYVFLRLTRFLFDVGYTELAVAAWQAVLEMTFCRPTSAPETREEAVALFGEFWESEAPRIGEDGARGWGLWNEDDEPWTTNSNGVDYAAEEDVDKKKHPSVWIRWAIVENRKSGRSCMPARTLDLDAQDDPYRVVTFDDIKDVLVWIPTPVLPITRSELIEGFLLFCGLPTAGLSDGLMAAARNDPFLAIRNAAFEDGLGRTKDRTDTEATTPKLEIQQQGGNMVLSQEILFSPSWFRYLDTWRDGPGQVRMAWILGTLKYLVGVCKVEALAEYYLALDWADDPAGAKKAAKSLLKQYSSDLRLYSAYALIESANGNPGVSETVLSAAANRLVRISHKQYEPLLISS